MAIGALWTIPKWYLWIRETRIKETLTRRFEHKLNEKKRAQNTLVDTNTIRSDVAWEIVTENKLKIWSWIAYWPWNILYTFARDPLIHLWNVIYDNLGKHYHDMLLKVMP